MEKELLNTQMNVENQTSTNSGEELIIQTEVTGTPFKIVTVNETGDRFLSIGQYRLTAGEYTTEQLLKLTEGIDWQFLCAVIGAITTQTVKSLNKI